MQGNRHQRQSVGADRESARAHRPYASRPAIDLRVRARGSDDRLDRRSIYRRASLYSRLVEQDYRRQLSLFLVSKWNFGESAPRRRLPIFNIVSKPNAWSHSVAQAARSIDDTELSETRILQRDYWAGLNAALDAAGGPVTGNRKPQPQSWMAFSIGRTDFKLGGVMIRPKKQIRSELYISSDRAKLFFRLLKEQQSAIEAELGYSLDWEELTARRDCRISSYLNDVDPEDQNDWPSQHAWLAKRLNDMHRVFVNRVASLDLTQSLDSL